jgi:hypothetical protein
LLLKPTGFSRWSFSYFARSFREFVAKVAFFKRLSPFERHPLYDGELLELNPMAKL